MNIVLIGYRCSGKSTVGKIVAERLKRKFIDSDDYIETKTNLKIREIFERFGESHFRTLEGQAIAEIAKLDGMVIATGGGAPLKYKNMQVLKRNGGRVFYLEIQADTALLRMAADPATHDRRPALTENDRETEIREQLKNRKSYYEKAAHHVLEVDELSVEDVVGLIMREVEDPWE